jgi:hypothetical protein
MTRVNNRSKPKENIGYAGKTPAFLQNSYNVKLCNIVDEILFSKHGFHCDETPKAIIEKLKPYLKEF